MRNHGCSDARRERGQHTSPMIYRSCACKSLRPRALELYRRENRHDVCADFHLWEDANGLDFNPRVEPKANASCDAERLPSCQGFRSTGQLEKGIGADRSTTERLLLAVGARKSVVAEEWTLNPL
jgi:hypothetical protein